VAEVFKKSLIEAPLEFLGWY